MSRLNLSDGSGRPLVLGREFASGGEGIVYTLRDDASQVAKLYRTPPSATTVDKLRWLVDHASPKLAAVAAWPTSLLLDGGNVVGFLMPNLAGYEPIHHLYNPAQRFKYFPRATWAFLVHVARNVAAAFDELHPLGVVVGDVNETNVRVSGAGLVKLIDCDSFQVTAGSHLYPCEVGVAHYTPPELQGRSFVGLTRTPNHDRFGLAVLLFQLLFVGRHPYAGVVQGTDEVSIERSIAEYRFAYGTPATTPPFALTLRELPPWLAELFGRAFERVSQDNSRPDAMAWCAALADLARELTPCQVDAGHVHWSGAACPWCRIGTGLGPDFFLGVSDDSLQFHLDEARLQQAQEQLKAADLAAFWYRREDHLQVPVPTPTSLSAISTGRFLLLLVVAGFVAFSLLLAITGFWLEFSRPRPPTPEAEAMSAGGTALTVLSGAWLYWLKRDPKGRERARRQAARTEATEALAKSEAAYKHKLRQVWATYQENVLALRRQLDDCRRLRFVYDEEVKQLTRHGLSAARMKAALRAVALRCRREQQTGLASVAASLPALLELRQTLAKELSHDVAHLRRVVARWAQAEADWALLVQVWG